MKTIAWVLVGVWLVVSAFLKLTHWHVPYQSFFLALLALSAGILLLLSEIKSRLGDIGLLLLAVWLILTACIHLFHVSFPYRDTTAAILAFVSGILLILRK